MRRHLNPYRILDHKNWLEVSENSSHPELNDARRIWKFQAYTFTTATEVDKFFATEGLKLSDYATEPVWHKEYGKNLIIVNIVPKYLSRNERGLRSIRA